MRTKDFWDRKLEEALKEVVRLRLILGLLVPGQPSSKRIRRRKSFTIRATLAAQDRKRLKMLEGTKIPYYRQRLSELIHRSIWDRVLGKDIV